MYLSHILYTQISLPFLKSLTRPRDRGPFPPKRLPTSSPTFYSTPPLPSGKPHPPQTRKLCFGGGAANTLKCSIDYLTNWQVCPCVERIFLLIYFLMHLLWSCFSLPQFISRRSCLSVCTSCCRRSWSGWMLWRFLNLRVCRCRMSWQDTSSCALPFFLVKVSTMTLEETCSIDFDIHCTLYKTGAYVQRENFSVMRTLAVLANSSYTTKIKTAEIFSGASPGVSTKICTHENVPLYTAYMYMLYLIIFLPHQ